MALQQHGLLELQIWIELRIQEVVRLILVNIIQVELHALDQIFLREVSWLHCALGLNHDEKQILVFLVAHD